MAVSLAAGIIAWVMASARPPVYETSFALTVKLKTSQAGAKAGATGAGATVENYEKNVFFAMKSSEMMLDSLVSWLITPSEVLEIYRRAGINPPVTISKAGIMGEVNRYKLTRVFRPNKLSYQVLLVTLRSTNRQEAGQLALAAAEYLKHGGEAIVSQADNTPVFLIEPSQPVTFGVDRHPWLSGVMALIAAFITASLVVFLKENKGKI